MKLIHEAEGGVSSFNQQINEFENLIKSETDKVRLKRKKY